MVGMLISEHHSTGGYSRYDRTQKQKMEAMALVSTTPGLDYEKAIGHVSKNYVRDKFVGSCEDMKPLVDRVSEKANVPPSLMTVAQVSLQTLMCFLSGFFCMMADESVVG